MSSIGILKPADRLREATAPHHAHASPLRVRIVETPAADSWSRYVASHSDSTLFHSWGWRQAVIEAFGHQAVYLAAQHDYRVVGVLPLCLIPSRIAGRMLVSIPYGVGGGILADDQAAADALFEGAKTTAADHGCNIIDLRSERAAVPSLPVVADYVGFERELPDDPQDILTWLPRKARAAARNARDKHHLTVDWGAEHLHDVWRLYTLNMRRLGSIGYPYRFFESLLAHTPGAHWVSLIRRGDRPVAGLVSFLFRDRVMPYFFGATHEARRCGAANYAYLTLMERAVERGLRTFDFGRSRRDNSGSYDFKRFHGFEPHPLEYQMYIAPGGKPISLSPDSPRFRLARRVWRHLPLRLTQALGARLSRHIPG